MSNVLTNYCPKIAEEWHPTKNGKLTANDVTYGTKKMVWWKCSRGHEWEARIDQRVKSQRCMECHMEDNNLAKLYPELLEDWDYEKNEDIPPEKILCGSGKIYWWKCKNGHSYKKALSDKIYTPNCQMCPQERNEYKSKGTKIPLSESHPQYAATWNYDKNGNLTPDDITYGSRKNVWWKCEKGHTWQARVNQRIRKKVDGGCPYCSGKCTGDDNNLEYLYPNIAREWHPTKNGETKAKDVTPGTNRKFWWQCDKGHEWEASVVGRVAKKSNCLYCCGYLVEYSESFEAKFPDLAKEWDNEKNDIKPSEVMPNSHKRVHWKCAEGHMWKVQVYNRSRGSDCPGCSIGSFSKIAIKWLEWYSENYDIKIKHALNGGEEKIKLYDGRIIKVDGYSKITKTVWEFLGCMWHAHPKEICMFSHNRDLEDINQFNGKKNKDLYDDTLQRIKDIKKSGYKIIFIWECDFQKNILC